MLTRLLCTFLVAAQALPALAEPAAKAAAACAYQGATDRDGQRDFDFEIGEWTTRLKRLRQPLSGSREWAEYEGTSTVTKTLDGRANLVELKVEGPAGRIEGISLRLYNPETRQWSLNFASARSGALSPPVYGGFAGNCGEFYGQDTWNGRAILVRFVISDITPATAHFEQAFSIDGGRTWEVNWIANDSRRR